MTTLVETHRAALDALKAETLQRPTMPVAVYLLEKDQLLALAAEPEVMPRLVKVGLAPDFAGDFTIRIATLREAQQNWWLGSSRRKPEEQAADEIGLRDDIDEGLDQLRWYGRADRELQAVIDKIEEGEGVADLLADGDDTAALLTRHAALFATVDDFDPVAHASQLRDRTARVRAGQIGFTNDRSKATLIDDRDRAYAWCNALADDIVKAGRFAFRADEALAARFGSAYAKARGRRARRAKKAGPGDEKPK